MKKKLLLSLLLIFGFMMSVNAKDSVLNLDTLEVKAKAPSQSPNAGDTMYATLTDKFDFSRIPFEAADGGTINGMTDVRKIILSNTLNYQTTDLSLDIVLGSKWFTVYCLDGKLNYPQYGTYTSTRFLEALDEYRAATNDEGRNEALNKALNQAARGALVNNTSVQSVLKLADGYVVGPDVEIALENGKNINDYFDIDGTNVALKSGNLTVLVKRVLYTNLSFETKSFTGTDLAKGGTTVEVDGVEAFPLTFKAEDVAFDKYTTTNDLNDDKYEQALWILEHSYPAISLDETFALVGINKETLLSQLKAVDSRMTTDEISEKYLENYVYSTIQYAIWKIYDGKENLGSHIKNVSETKQLTELDKLYTFYLEDRDEYEGYSKLTSGGVINITRPESGKELYKTTDSEYTYGPFKANFTGIYANEREIELTIKNSDKTGIKIIDKNGTEKDHVNQNEEFYVVISKNAQIGSVSIETSVLANTYSPNLNRGKIYYPKYVLAQNLMSGGRIATAPITGNLEFAVNAKTGVEDVAVLLMVTLVAFSLGYLVLSYKGRGSFLK